MTEAEAVQYLASDGRWIALSQEQLTEWMALGDEMERISNASTGCPFDLKLQVKADGKQYQVSASTDSCGVLIIEDQTYQLAEDKRGVLRALFPEAPWQSD